MWTTLGRFTFTQFMSSHILRSELVRDAATARIAKTNGYFLICPWSL